MTTILNTQRSYSPLTVSSFRSPWPRASSNSVENALKPSILQVIRFDSCRLRWNRQRSSWSLCVRASSNRSVEQTGDGRARTLKEMIDALPAAIVAVRGTIGSKFGVVVFVVSALFAVVARQIMLKKQSRKPQGSVADLVRRGQLRSDRRGISTPLKYDDPFNNPLVKVGKGDSTIEMCGKVYGLAPVTLTEEQQSEHRKRRSRAYQWKRPKVFIKEGDSIPPDVDPDAVRWVPANHPFVTTVSDIDEKMAQENVFQKHGVPSRIIAEHEELRKKLEALQNDQSFNEVNINLRNIQDLKVESGSSTQQHGQMEPFPSIGTSQPRNGVTLNPNMVVDSNVNMLPDETKRKP